MDFKQFYNEIYFDINRELHQRFRGKQGDTHSRGFYITLVQNNTVVPITTQGMTFYCEKPDGKRVYIDAVVDGDKLRIDLTNQVFAAKGIVKCELTLIGDDGAKITSRTFNIEVDEQLAENSLISEDERGLIDEMLHFGLEEMPIIRENELDRQQNELTRVSNENTRVENEDQRVLSENNRESAENIRIASENTRVLSENTRSIDESTRKSNETARINSETIRKNNEISREQNENERQLGEVERAGNELGRIANMEVVEGWISNPLQFKGEQGNSIEYEWQGAELGVRVEGEIDYAYSNLKGDKGDSIEYDWSGTSLGIKTDKENNYIYVNLKGEKGETGEGLNILGSFSNESELPASGSVGDAYLIEGDLYVWDGNEFKNVGNIKGVKGDSIEYDWSGTKLGIRTEGELNYTYIDLRGPKGDDGKNIEYNWNNTKLGIRTEGESNYVYVDLKGAKGEPGTDANVTKNNITLALGYTPADKAKEHVHGNKNVLDRLSDVSGELKYDGDFIKTDLSGVENRLNHLEGVRVSVGNVQPNDTVLWLDTSE